MTELGAILDEAFGTPDEGSWPIPVDHLSATQITMYQRCREQYRRRYICGERERPGAALIVGSADHYAAEANFRQKIESAEDLSLDEVQDAYAAGWDLAIERAGGESEIVWGEEKPGKVKDSGAALVAVYHEQVAPHVQPIAVEREFSLPIEGVPVPVIGRVDVETAARAIERKTTQRLATRPKPQWWLQGLIYQLVSDATVDWHVGVRKSRPEVATPYTHEGLRLPYLPEHQRIAADVIRQTAASMLMDWERWGPDEPWPGSLTHDWSCRYCGFRPTCRWWVT
jgi:hypothetical protein